MARIEIRNIGPIKEASFELNKVNVFMGPQSSGKSTIAKIISYCTWLEKDIATSQSLSFYQENNTLIKDNIESFHKIQGYFKSGSSFSYSSNIVEIKWVNGQSSLKWKDQYAYKRSKIGYIPSERNMIVLPDVREVELGYTNIRSFLFEWFDVRKKYTSQNRLSILNLGIDYYYEEGSAENRIKGTKGDDEYDILLSNASSGLQSVTPLVAMIEYLTMWVYNEDKISFSQQEKQRKAIEHLINEKLLKPYYNQNTITEDEHSHKLQQFIELLDSNDDKAKQFFYEYLELQKQLFRPQNSQLIIEEPEQNLFPSTQRDLIYYMLRVLNDSERNHRLTFTTHSPYILYALNNCMLGGLVGESILDDKEADLEDFPSRNSWIHPDNVSIWQIIAEDGTIRSIKNDKIGTVSKHYFNGIMNEVMEEYYEMLTYLKEG